MIANNNQFHCSCKGIRSCSRCDDGKIKPENFLKNFIYCWQCENKCYEESAYYHHQNHESFIGNEANGDMMTIDGVFVQQDVLSFDEELELISAIDSGVWVDSQSGRRKQDFGPKINFKKQKINFSSFVGLPKPSMNILRKIKFERLKKNSQQATRFAFRSSSFESNETILNNFETVEVCHLEYSPERGSSIDAHFDDFWIWGERLVTLNLLSPTCLILTDPNDNKSFCIRVPLPARSILVLYDKARYQYHHSILRKDINARRLAITYRELSDSFFDKSQSSYANITEPFLSKSRILI